MLMICWYYCASFGKFLYFALPLVLCAVAALMLRRGMYRGRAGLRKAAFFLMLAAAFKAFIVDAFQARQVFCAYEGLRPLCGWGGALAAWLLGVLLFAAACWGVWRGWLACASGRRPPARTPEQARLRLWSGLSLTAVALMMLWTAVPWVGSLALGYVPRLFVSVPWHVPALAGFAALFAGFWRAEGCAVPRRAAHRSWDARDTLWTGFFLYLMTLALSYAASDVLGL